MAKKTHAPTYDEAVTWLRDHGFDILDAPGTQNRVFLKKLNVSAAIEKADDGSTRIFARPGYLISGEISRLVDKGYQKFLKSSKAEVPATADHLKALHQFSEELREAIGGVSMYDRVEDRDLPQSQRPKRAWEGNETDRRRA
jgi:hypothetical protein